MVLVLLAVFLITVMFVNVVSRAVLDADIAWNTEFGEFVLVWATFFGCAAAARRGLHMRIVELVSILPGPIRRVGDLATRLAIILLLALLVWKGLLIVSSTMEQQMSVLYWPVGLQYLAMPVGALLTMIFVLYETVLLASGVSDAGLHSE